MCFTSGKPQAKLSIVGEVVVQDTGPDGLEISASGDWRDLGDGIYQIIATLSGESDLSVEVSVMYRAVPPFGESED